MKKVVVDVVNLSMSKPINPFVLFGLNPHAEIDLAQLDQIYFSLQQAVHPDRFTNRSINEKLAAAEKSAGVNAAYETLKHPIERLWCILEACGIHVDRQQNINNNPELVEKVFELQEQLIEANSVLKQQAFNQQLQEILDQESQEFSAFIQAKNFETAVQKLYWMTYVYKIRTGNSFLTHLKVS